MTLRGKDLLSVNDLTQQDILSLFSLTRTFKKRPYATHLKRKTILMLFAKPSTRTRVSFEVAINHLGGDEVFLPMDELQFSRGESIEDTARVLARYGQGIVARLFRHETLQALAENADIPVINGLTDLLHPCQALTDLFTIQEKRRTLKGKVVFVGDGNNNVTHSLMLACSKLGVDLVVSCPPAYTPKPIIIKQTEQNNRQSGGSFRVVTNPKKAVQEADVLYTDTWVSMGEEKQSRARERAFKGYQLNRALFSRANPNCLVMHDLPAHRGVEITSDVMDDPRSVIFDQAENRMHMEKAILAAIYT